MDPTYSLYCEFSLLSAIQAQFQGTNFCLLPAARKYDWIEKEIQTSWNYTFADDFWGCDLFLQETFLVRRLLLCSRKQLRPGCLLLLLLVQGGGQGCRRRRS